MRVGCRVGTRVVVMDFVSVGHSREAIVAEASDVPDSMNMMNTP